MRTAVSICHRAAVALAVLAAIGITGCGGELPLVQQVHQQCANASDKSACEEAAYARAYDEERARNRHTYW